jgi:molybdopterin-guanine dinucleotide biosynthesis protein A
MQGAAELSIVIQAGGQSSRMGQDKALMLFLGRPLIVRLVERLSKIADEVIITTNHPDDYAFLNLPLFSDLLPGAGALGGLLTALSAAAHPLVGVIACDMPFVQPALLQAQRKLLVDEQVDVVVPRTAESLEPLHAIYRRASCLPAVKSALEAGERRMISWFPQVKVRVMPPEEIALIDPQFRSFINVNSPEEFRSAEEDAVRLGEG